MMDFNIERDQYEMVKLRDKLAMSVAQAIYAEHARRAGNGWVRRDEYSEIAKDIWALADALVAARVKP